MNMFATQLFSKEPDIDIDEDEQYIKETMEKEGFEEAEGGFEGDEFVPLDDLLDDPFADFNEDEAEDFENELESDDY